MSMFGASNRRFIGPAQDTAGRSKRKKKRSLFAGLAKKRKPVKSKKRSR